MCINVNKNDLLAPISIILFNIFNHIIINEQMLINIIPKVIIVNSKWNSNTYGQCLSIK